ncbi:hypothetical protein L7F22_013061, partial [Adiantum nelumboides]|nr:hypothetical protein [Adiantum nelumboides]
MTTTAAIQEGDAKQSLHILAGVAASLEEVGPHRHCEGAEATAILHLCVEPNAILQASFFTSSCVDGKLTKCQRASCVAAWAPCVEAIATNWTATEVRE